MIIPIAKHTSVHHPRRFLSADFKLYFKGFQWLTATFIHNLAFTETYNTRNQHQFKYNDCLTANDFSQEEIIILVMLRKVFTKAAAYFSSNFQFCLQRLPTETLMFVLPFALGLYPFALQSVAQLVLQYLAESEQRVHFRIHPSTSIGSWIINKH